MTAETEKHYAAIRSRNAGTQGCNPRSVGDAFFPALFANRTQFLIELLQNAQDALQRRPGWSGSRTVSLQVLSYPSQAGKFAVRFSHFGLPFSSENVDAICGLNLSTKRDDFNQIGRFGMGFKSVFAVTSRPEIHSGADDFKILDYMLPIAADPVEREPEETVIMLPLYWEGFVPLIEQELRGWGPRILLFLRDVQEFHWAVAGGHSGVYGRQEGPQLSKDCRTFSLTAIERGGPERSEYWVVFSRQVTHKGRAAGQVEIAFAATPGVDGAPPVVRRSGRVPAYVFFPTRELTELGFIVNGPYVTTLSRETMQNDEWNNYLAIETGHLVVESLAWLRDQGLLDHAWLGCMPLEGLRSPGGLHPGRFLPIAVAVEGALRSERLWPCHTSGYALAKDTRRTDDAQLRELISDQQLTRLQGLKTELRWLAAADWKLGRLHDRFQGKSLTSTEIVQAMTREFLMKQPDEWIARLYGYLSSWKPSTPTVDLRNLPLVRLEGGEHVPARRDGGVQAFLPSPHGQGLPMVSEAVLASPEAEQFLRSLGITRPAPIDRVTRRILTIYQEDGASPGPEYGRDLQELRAAYESDDESRSKLTEVLKCAFWVAAIEQKTGERALKRPREVYVGSTSLSETFSGVPGVWIVDGTLAPLNDEIGRLILTQCDARNHLIAVPDDGRLARDAKARMRADQQRVRKLLRASQISDLRYSDFQILDLRALLDTLPALSVSEREARSAGLWRALCELVAASGEFITKGEYAWHVSAGNWSDAWDESVTFESGWVGVLNAAAWICGPTGQLCRPEDVEFDTLGWPSQHGLQSAMRFQPSNLTKLADGFGLETALLRELRHRGLTKLEQVFPTPPPEPPPKATDTPPLPVGTPPDRAARTAADGVHPGETAANGSRTAGGHDDAGREPSGSGRGAGAPEGGTGDQAPGRGARSTGLPQGDGVGEHGGPTGRRAGSPFSSHGAPGSRGAEAGGADGETPGSAEDVWVHINGARYAAYPDGRLPGLTEVVDKLLRSSNGAAAPGGSSRLKSPPHPEPEPSGGGRGWTVPWDQNERNLIVGAVGELAVLRHLELTSGGAITAAAWRSGMRARVLDDGDAGDDELGYDFKFSREGREYEVEVKATKSSRPEWIELGRTEVAAARRRARDGSGVRWEIWLVADALANPTIHVLGNPYAKGEEEKFTICESSVRVGFALG